MQDVAQAFSWEDGRLMSFAFIEEFVFVCLFVCLFLFFISHCNTWFRISVRQPTMLVFFFFLLQPPCSVSLKHSFQFFPDWCVHWTRFGLKRFLYASDVIDKIHSTRSIQKYSRVTWLSVSLFWLAQSKTWILFLHRWRTVATYTGWLFI